MVERRGCGSGEVLMDQSQEISCRRTGSRRLRLGSCEAGGKNRSGQLRSSRRRPIFHCCKFPTAYESTKIENSQFECKDSKAEDVGDLRAMLQASYRLRSEEAKMSTDRCFRVGFSDLDITAWKIAADVLNHSKSATRWGLRVEVLRIAGSILSSEIRELQHFRDVSELNLDPC